MRNDEIPNGFAADRRPFNWRMFQTSALERAIEERLSRVAPPAPTDRKAALDAFFEPVSRMPVLDSRPVDEIVGYDGYGLPS
jgi:hypothetical protein